jgi:hypothetical protein
MKRLKKKTSVPELGWVAHAYNPSILKAEAGGTQVQDQTGPQSKTLTTWQFFEWVFAMRHDYAHQLAFVLHE